MSLNLEVAEDMIRKQVAALEAEIHALNAQQQDLQRRSRQLLAERQAWLAAVRDADRVSEMNRSNGEFATLLNHQNPD